MSNSLKNCPFCGFMAGLYVSKKGVRAGCLNPGCLISTPNDMDGFDELTGIPVTDAIDEVSERWNRRVSDKKKEEV